MKYYLTGLLISLLAVVYMGGIQTIQTLATNIVGGGFCFLQK